MQFDAPIFRCMYMHFILLINYNSIIRNSKNPKEGQVKVIQVNQLQKKLKNNAGDKNPYASNFKVIFNQW